MTWVHRLEAAQQISAICLLAQVQGDQLRANLSSTCMLSINLRMGKRGMRVSTDFRQNQVCSGCMAMTQRIVVYIGTSGVSPERFILVIATATLPQASMPVY